METYVAPGDAGVDAPDADALQDVGEAPDVPPDTPEDMVVEPAPDPCENGRDHLDFERLADGLAWVDANSDPTDSYLVSHCGEPLIEAYFNGYDADVAHDLQSATKTFTAVLIGIAIELGIVAGLDQPIAQLLPDYAHLLEGDKALITVEHALTMTTGLAWVDFGPGNSFDRIRAAEDSVAFILGEPLESAPGEAFFYNTGSSHLLSAIIHYASGMTTLEFAEAHLFGPLAITDYTWPTLPDGVHQGGWGLHLKPTDFLKFGQLLLDEGRWDGVQVVPRAYVDAATDYQIRSGPSGGYGYQMWIDTRSFDVDDIAGARGYGGQDCLVMEDLGIVVVFTGSILEPAQMARDVRTVVNRYVIPAHDDVSHTAP